MSTNTAGLHWFVPLEKLDSRQKEFIDTYQKPAANNIFLQGPPGSGKTILLVNIINQLRRANPNLRVGLVTYTHSLIDMLSTGLAAGSGAMTYRAFENSTTRYDVLIVDEVQDLPQRVLQRIRDTKARIIVAGDPNQRIYRDGCQEGVIRQALGLENDDQLFPISVSHRLTPSLFRAARIFKPQVQQTNESSSKTDVRPELACAQNSQKELEYVYKRARLGPENGQLSAILLPTKETIIDFANAVLAYEGKPMWNTQLNNFGQPHFGNLNAYLQQHAVPLEIVQNGYGSLAGVVQNKRVVLQTYHSAKGLDYNNVYLPFLYQGRHIGDFEPETLFYVALTRSRGVMCMSYTGTPHPYLTRISAHCKSVEADSKWVQAFGSGAGLGDDL